MSYRHWKAQGNIKIKALIKALIVKEKTEVAIFPLLLGSEDLLAMLLLLLCKGGPID